MSTNHADAICGKAVRELAENGSREALSVIYDSMARLIFSVAYGITGNHEDAEDVLQDTLIEIVTYAHTWQGGNVRAWVLTMTRHLAVDVVRRRKPAVPLDEQIEAKKPAVSFRLEVLELLDILSEEERQLVLLRLYAGLTYREIAKILEISVAAAQKRYQRAIQKLKRCHL